MPDARKKTIEEIYRLLCACFGPQHWWPGETPFEVMVGAILTQSASWRNVEIAINSLKEAGAMSPQALRDIDVNELAKLVHSSGYYNAKARKLKALAEWLGSYGDNLGRAFSGELAAKREELLVVYGVGEETADSILLYAADKPVLVIDAYTRRIVERIGIAPQKDNYEAYQRLFMSNLKQDVRVFNEYHALLVRLGKDICRKTPLCAGCCLNKICAYGQRVLASRG
jgi:endonuclease III related protein